MTFWFMTSSMVSVALGEQTHILDGKSRTRSEVKQDYRLYNERLKANHTFRFHQWM